MSSRFITVDGAEIDLHEVFETSKTVPVEVISGDGKYVATIDRRPDEDDELKYPKWPSRAPNAVCDWCKTNAWCETCNARAVRAEAKLSQALAALRDVEWQGWNGEGYDPCGEYCPHCEANRGNDETPGKHTSDCAIAAVLAL